MDTDNDTFASPEEPNVIYPDLTEETSGRIGTSADRLTGDTELTAARHMSVIPPVLVELSPIVQ